MAKLPLQIVNRLTLQREFTIKIPGQDSAVAGGLPNSIAEQRILLYWLLTKEYSKERPVLYSNSVDGWMPTKQYTTAKLYCTVTQWLAGCLLNREEL